MAGEFIDEESQLPTAPWPVLVRNWEKCLLPLRNEYEDIRERLLDSGFVFAELFGDSLGSLVKLFSNGDGLMFFPEDAPEWEFQIEAIDDAWVSKRIGPGGQWWTLAFAEMFDSGSVEPSLDSWAVGLHNPLFFVNQEARFNAGMAIRDAGLFYQYRIAKMLENVFCLDDRGRPSSR